MDYFWRSLMKAYSGLGRINVSLKTKSVKIRVKLNSSLLSYVNTVGNHSFVFIFKLCFENQSLSYIKGKWNSTFYSKIVMNSSEFKCCVVFFWYCEKTLTCSHNVVTTLTTFILDQILCAFHSIIYVEHPLCTQVKFCAIKAPVKIARWWKGKWENVLKTRVKCAFKAETTPLVACHRPARETAGVDKIT